MTTTLRYRAVVFDLDGTLVDSYAALAHAVNVALREEGLRTLRVGEIKGLVGEGIERLLTRATGLDEVPASLRRRFEHEYGLVCREMSRLIDGAHETLAEFDRLGVPMAVCTNKPTGFSRIIVEHLGIAKFLTGVIGPDEAGARKPDAMHVLRALATTGHEPPHALFVGDMPIDVRAARAASLDVAVLPTGSSPRDELAAALPDYLLDRLIDVVAVVEGRVPSLTT